MVHVELSWENHKDLCKLKPKARQYFLSYWDNCPGVKKFYKGKVSIDEVIKFILQKHGLRFL